MRPSRPPLDHTHTPPTHSDRHPCHCPVPLFCKHLQHRKPTSRTPPSLPPAWLLPLHLTPHPPQTSNLTIVGNTSTSSPLPQLPCRSNHTHHHNSLPPSGAHRATSAPRHLHALPPQPAHGSRTHVLAPPPRTVQHQPQLHSSSTLRSVLFQNDPHHHFIKHSNLPLPVSHCNPSLRLPAGPASKAACLPPPPQRHHHRPQPRKHTPGQHTIKSQHTSNLPSSPYKWPRHLWLLHHQWS